LFVIILSRRKSLVVLALRLASSSHVLMKSAGATLTYKTPSAPAGDERDLAL
jgi:hypothetical protein